MPKDSTSGKSRANRIRAVRQDELRAKLASQGHIQHIIEIAKKLRDFSIDLDPLQVQRLRAAAEQHRHLVDKYLASLKAIEHTGDVNTGLADLLSDLAQVERKHAQDRPLTAPESSDTPPKRLN